MDSVLLFLILLWFLLFKALFSLQSFFFDYMIKNLKIMREAYWKG